MTLRDTPSDRVRLDVWLDIACLFKTRSEAQRACRIGRVDVNDQRAQPPRTLQRGDRLSITRPNGRKQQVVVLFFANQHVPRATANTLYDDVTPPPTAAKLGQHWLGSGPCTSERRGPGRKAGASTPNTRQRRELRRLKEH